LGVKHLFQFYTSCLYCRIYNEYFIWLTDMNFSLILTVFPIVTNKCHKSHVGWPPPFSLVTWYPILEPMLPYVSWKWLDSSRMFPKLFDIVPWKFILKVRCHQTCCFITLVIINSTYCFIEPIIHIYNEASSEISLASTDYSSPSMWNITHVSLRYKKS
jgi:hypothetical protein